MSSSRELFAGAHPGVPASYLIAHVDGGSRGNPGPAGYGVVVRDHSGRKVAELSEYIGRKTNNVAEYNGLLAALRYALQHGPKALKVVSDSELMVLQIKGIYKVKNEALRELYQQARQHIAELEWFTIEHALRDKNQHADRLANQAMDQGMGRKPPSQPGDKSMATTAAAVTRDYLEGEVLPDGLIRVNGVSLPPGTRVLVKLKNQQK
jgi:ribonuclease HI